MSANGWPGTGNPENSSPPKSASLVHARELGAAEVVAFTEVHNVRSRAVMERLGFTYRHDVPHRGEPFALYTIALAS
ncbi:hypothetical protein A4R44_03116 [Amycolatopsis sp. M39]|nr:hypothetical protein A4R44_03116 [Amycolatopsis sp. M39]